MLESISPYALLKASKPKPANAQQNAVDTFSCTVQHHAAFSSENQKAYLSASEEQAAVPFSVAATHEYAPPYKKTHYIADIHARHSTASRQAGQELRTL